MDAISPPADCIGSVADVAPLAARLRALSHPARLQVLATLARHEQCVCGEIVRGLPLAQSTVSEHLKVLLAAGLIAGKAEGQRSCYCLDLDGVRTLKAELDALFSALLPPPAASPADAA